MFSYQPTYENDLLVIQWLERMRVSGDLDRVLARDFHVPSSALTYFRDKAKLIVEADDDGIWLATWFEPTMSGAFIGLWIAPHKRHSPSALIVLESIIGKALTIWPVLMNVTSDPALSFEYQKFGWEYKCDIPKLFDGKDVYFLTLTREQYDGRKRREADRIELPTGITRQHGEGAIRAD